jgi:hypothetical protein
MSFEDTVSALKARGHIWEKADETSIKSVDFLGTFKSLNEASKKQKLKGGKGDKLTADQVNYFEFRKGWKIELEHTDDIDKAKEIALDHLAEDPNYYTRLDIMEFQAKKKARTDLPIDISKKNAPKKDEANQMVPVEKKKEKTNVSDNQGNKEKARSKTAGMKKMKGGSGEMKSLREGLTPELIAAIGAVGSVGGLYILIRDAIIKKTIKDKKDLQDALKQSELDAESIKKAVKKLRGQSYFEKLVDKENSQAKADLYTGVHPNEGVKEEAPRFSNRAETYIVRMKYADGVNEKKTLLTPAQVSDLRKNSQVISVTLEKDIAHEKTTREKYYWKKEDGAKWNSGDLSKEELEKFKADHPKEVILTKQEFEDSKKKYVKPEPGDKPAVAAKPAVGAEKKTPPSKPNIPKGELKNYDIKYPNSLKWDTVKLTDDDVQKLKDKGVEVKSTDISGKDKTKAFTTFAPGVRPNDAKSHYSSQGGASGSSSKPDVPVNDPKKLYYSANKGTGHIKGFDSYKDAKDHASKNSGYEAMPYLGAKAKGFIKEEAPGKEAEKTLLSKTVTFSIPGGGDADQQEQITNSIRSANFDKKKKELKLDMTDGAKLVFTPDASGTPVGVYFDKKGINYKVSDMKDPLTKIVDKIYEPQESTLEAYIRKRINEAVLKAVVMEQGDLQDFTKSFFGMKKDDSKKESPVVLSDWEKSVVMNAKKYNNPRSSEFKLALSDLQELVDKYGKEGKSLPKEVTDAVKHMSDLNKQ